MMIRFRIQEIIEEIDIETWMRLTIKVRSGGLVNRMPIMTNMSPELKA